jgi:flagellar assembly factor FliW
MSAPVTPIFAMASGKDAIVTFPDGLPGFEATRQYVLVTSEALHPFTLVQGIGDGAPSFLAIDPARIDGAYAPALSAGDAHRLGAADGQPLLWLALVTAAAGAPVEATVNLRAPLAINPAAMVGIQVIDGDASYRFDHPLTPA